MLIGLLALGIAFAICDAGAHEGTCVNRRAPISRSRPRRSSASRLHRRGLLDSREGIRRAGADQRGVGAHSTRREREARPVALGRHRRQSRG